MKSRIESTSTMLRGLHLEGRSALGTLILMTALLFGAGLLAVFSQFDVTLAPSTLQSTDQPPMSEYRRGSSLENYSGNLDSLDRRKRPPKAIIIGTRKSGTRALLKFLQLNPNVRAAHKEVHFFDRDQNYHRGLAWYVDQMPESLSSDVVIEKSPSYFVTPNVPERVKIMNASLKLIVILRDPVIRLISDYSQLVANHMNDSTSREYYYDDDYATVAANGPADGCLDCSGGQSAVNQTWSQAERSFERYVFRPDGGIDERRQAIRVGMYSMHLERWQAVFPRHQFHFVDGEALIKRPWVELRKVETFLQVKPSISKHDFVFNQRKGFFCLDTKRERRSISARRGQELTSIKQSDEKTADMMSGCLSKTKGRRHIAVRRNLMEDLHKFYEPYNEYLYSLTNISFKWPQIQQ